MDNTKIKHVFGWIFTGHVMAGIATLIAMLWYISFFNGLKVIITLFLTMILAYILTEMLLDEDNED
ncbi:MAG: hypothetical protein ACOH2D_11750 [Gelidibacter sp.]